MQLLFESVVDVPESSDRAGALLIQRLPHDFVLLLEDVEFLLAIALWPEEFTELPAQGIWALLLRILIVDGWEVDQVPVLDVVL